ncbi:hypothetical protein BB561_003508 [Smittium simulii]|uniref:OPT family small oligopeptide transporter n=1 Tax=Smittium simulii TaxID=133385 RepID=A0A2T9YKW2_9FUNG|nr:hypothetical protein BB561_003508 [Smittium simulii]
MSLKTVNNKGSNKETESTEEQGLLRNDSLRTLVDDGLDSNELGEQICEAIRANVSSTDDHTLPTLTFRLWIIGIIMAMFISFINHFFFFRQTPITMGFSVDILLTFILGKAWERLMPNKDVRLFGIKKLTFKLNPGKFSSKEHALLCVFVSSGAGVAYAIEVVAMQDLFYNSKSTIFYSFLFIFCTQMIGFGIAGIARNVLVQPTIMVWPNTLIRCSMYRTLHEEDSDYSGKSKSASNFRFFVIACTAAFLYHIFPGYLFQLLSSVSILCFIFPKSIIAQQLGSGTHGLGMGALSFDWSVIASYLGSPLATPFWSAVNIFAGFVFIAWM